MLSPTGSTIAWARTPISVRGSKPFNLFRLESCHFGIRKIHIAISKIASIWHTCINSVDTVSVLISWARLAGICFASRIDPARYRSFPRVCSLSFPLIMPRHHHGSKFLKFGNHSPPPPTFRRFSFFLLLLVLSFKILTCRSALFRARYARQARDQRSLHLR
jgi:hypothetical protein